MEIAVDQNWIRAIDHVLPPEFCDHLIEKYQACAHRHTVRTDYPRLRELNMWSHNHRSLSPIERMFKSTDSVWDFTQDCETIMSLIYPVLSDYKQHWDRYNSFPDEYAMEGFRIKSYRAGTGDGFPIHVDSRGREMSTRFLAFLFYLNDSDAGTEFPMEQLTISARQGRLVIFPPGLQWPHIGQEPQSTDKYILSTYLHFSQ